MTTTETRHKPPGWRLTPRAVITFITGDTPAHEQLHTQGHP